MGREIEFRAWDKIYKKMFIPGGFNGFRLFLESTGVLSQFIPCTVGQYGLNNPGTHARMQECNRFEIMQYTGLKDRNGVKIFEGDILQLIGNYQGTLKAQILFKNAKFMMEVFYEHKNRCHAIHPYNLYWDVVGNIYENPELLNTTEGKNEND